MVMYRCEATVPSRAYRMIFVPGAVLSIISDRPSPSKS
jgi:hypothetical protein